MQLVNIPVPEHQFIEHFCDIAQLDLSPSDRQEVLAVFLAVIPSVAGNNDNPFGVDVDVDWMFGRLAGDVVARTPILFRKIM